MVLLWSQEHLIWFVFNGYRSRCLGSLEDQIQASQALVSHTFASVIFRITSLGQQSYIKMEKLRHVKIKGMFLCYQWKYQAQGLKESGAQDQSQQGSNCHYLCVHGQINHVGLEDEAVNELTTLVSQDALTWSCMYIFCSTVSGCLHNWPHCRYEMSRCFCVGNS